MTGHDDRRHALRVNARLNLQVSVPRADGSVATASLETINISTSGIYFRSGHFIEPMTKLAMEIEVSVPAGVPGEAPVTAPVPCEGLVVRSAPEEETAGCSEYDVAVFFTHVEPAGRENLEKHIAMLLSDPD